MPVSTLFLVCTGTRGGNNVKVRSIGAQRIYSPDEGSWSLCSPGYPTVWMSCLLLPWHKEGQHPSFSTVTAAIALEWQRLTQLTAANPKHSIKSYKYNLIIGGQLFIFFLLCCSGLKSFAILKKKKKKPTDFPSELDALTLDWAIESQLFAFLGCSTCP